MQAITPVTSDQLLAFGQEPKVKLEIYVDPYWVNICDGFSFLLSACDATTDWSTTGGGVLSIDTADKKEGTGSLKNTRAAPAAASWYETYYNPAGTWDWSAKKHILFWLKCDRANTAFGVVTLMIHDSLNNYRYWNLAFSAGEWTAFKLLLSTGDGESGTPPDLALINKCTFRFFTADTTPFYKKIDYLRLDDVAPGLKGKNYLESVSVSLGGASMTPDPIAGSWSAVINNENNIFYPDHPTSAYIDYFKIGRKVRISLGATYGGTGYYWQRIIGYMQEPRFSIDDTKVKLNGFDYMQLLTDTELRKPDNYWGSSITKSTIASGETLGTEKYIEVDAMDIAADANNVANWLVLYGAAIGSPADAGGGSTWVGEVVKDNGGGFNMGYAENNNVGNVEQGKEYKVVFKYRMLVDWNLSVGIYKTATYWTALAPKVVGDTVEPTVGKENNCYYVCTVAGTTGALEPAWPTVENGGIVDGTVTWATKYMDGKKMGEITGLTSDVTPYVEESFYFTATETCAIKMRLTVKGAGHVATTARIDVISIKEITGFFNASYNLPDECNGIHYAVLDGDAIWPGKQKGEGWYYDSELKFFHFDEEKHIDEGTDNLVIHYYTQQVPENIVADLLVTAKLYSNRIEALTAMNYTATTQTFEVLESRVLVENRVNQGVAKDENGNFYVFSHDITINGTVYIDVVTKYDSDWNYVSEYKSQDGKVDGGAEAWIFGDGSVIDGKLYIGLRRRYFTAAAIGIWDLDLNYESIHPTEGGCPEAIQKHDGYYWIIQGYAGDKKYTIAKYNTSWVHQNTYNLTAAYGYDGFAWKDGQIYCNRGGCEMHIYKFDGSNFTFFYQVDSLGDEGFCLDGEIFYFAGEDNNTVWIGDFTSKIDQVWFEAGKSVLNAIKLVCERINYRFYFSYDGTPVFKPAPSIKPSGSEDFSLCQCHIAGIGENQDKSELWNRVVIEGIKEALPEGAEETRPSELKGEVSNETSIDAYGEHTKTIKNHLFQTQAAIDIYKAIYLATFKDPKWYDNWATPYNPAPLELRDTVRWQVRLTPSSGYGKAYGSFKYGDGTKYGSNGIIIVRRGLVRDIKIEDFNVQYTLEKAT